MSAEADTTRTCDASSFGTLCAKRDALIRTATPGSQAARSLCALTDDAVRALAAEAAGLISGRWAIVALGGWGAGAMLPASDLDILVLSDEPAARLKPFVEAVLYPLWDSGLEVGHQVRSPKQQQRAMREDHKTLTAGLTGRFLAGDEQWAEKVLADCRNDARKRSRAVLKLLATRERSGSPYLLEPDLKDGAGGRRDYDELVWTAVTLTGAYQNTPAELVQLGVLAEDELAAVTAAAETVATARWELQRDGFGQRMSLDALESLTAVDAEVVQAALGNTALALLRARARVARKPVPAGAPVDSSAVLGALERGEAALEDLELWAQAGLLDPLIPGARELMATRRPGLGHELTVGAHCMKAACIIGTLCDGPLGRSHEQLGRDGLRVARVAALAHDVGKVDGGAGHAERGAEPARATALRFGLTERDADRVAALVRLHLVLVETALREDLDDEDAILRCAARIEDSDVLAPLHLLTAADSMATGPATWTPWTAALVGTLVARLDVALSPDTDGAGLVSRGEAVRAATLAAMPAALNAERAFIEAAPLRYLASRKPESIARDARLVSELSRVRDSAQMRTAVSPGPTDNTYAVTVVAADRPNLLARLAGAMALAGLDILALEAFGAPGHLALDTFVVTSATKADVTTETFALLDRLVVTALTDRLEIATRLAERRRHYPPSADGPVQVETIPTGWATMLRVTAPDRPGLLWDIARAVAEEGLDIRWAKARSIEGTATDTFHVVGPDGGPVDDPGVLGHIAMGIRANL